MPKTSSVPAGNVPRLTVFPTSRKEPMTRMSGETSWIWFWKTAEGFPGSISTVTSPGVAKNMPPRPGWHDGGGWVCAAAGAASRRRAT